MEVPGLGKLKKDKASGEYASAPIAVAMLGGKKCQFILEEYEDDARQADFQQAIANFLAAQPAVLRAADDALSRYYQDMESYWPEDEKLHIESAEELWKLVELGGEVIVSRRAHGDQGIYLSLSCECEWEPEHGLQIVFKNGQQVNKLGEYDSHLTNSDAYDDKRFENVIYVSRSDL